jgi:hypothetical protein
MLCRFRHYRHEFDNRTGSIVQDILDSGLRRNDALKEFQTFKNFLIKFASAQYKGIAGGSNVGVGIFRFFFKRLSAAMPSFVIFQSTFVIP